MPVTARYRPALESRVRAAGPVGNLIGQAPVATVLPSSFLTAGIAVISWTANDEASMRPVVGAGVDGMSSNYPELLARVLDA